MENKNEYTHPMCGNDVSTVMCKRSPKDDFEHYGTYWYGYRDVNGKLYYGR